MKKRLVFLMTAMLISAALAGCGGSAQTSAQDSASQSGAAETAEQASLDASDGESAADTQADGKTYKIGVIQLTEHPALDAANKGFIAALDDAGIAYEADQQNAQNDQSACQTIAEKLVNDGNDLILAIATPAAQAVAGITEDIPILVTAITDPADAKLVDSNEKPGRNVSGTSDLTPVKEQIDLMKKLVPDVGKVGILYCSAESNSKFQASVAEEACENAGLESEIFTVASSNEIQSVVESMVSKVDAIYAPTDNTIAGSMATVAMVANENGVPVICGEGGMVENGGLATYGIDYYQLGYLTGKQAVDILVNGADISAMPIGYLPAENCELTTNEDTAAQLNIDLSVLE